MLEPAYVVGPSHWSLYEASDWIVFRGEAVKRLPPHSLSLDSLIWVNELPVSLVAALEARAAGKPWEPDEELLSPAWRFRAWAKQVMRELRLPAGECLQKLREMRAFAADQTARYERARHDLNHAAAAERLEVEGRPASSPTSSSKTNEPYQSIPAGSWDGLRMIDPWGWFKISYDRRGWEWLHDPGPFFYDVRFRIADVKKLWPAGAATRLKKRPSPAALLEWWLCYLQQHPDPDTRPNAQQQLAAATAHFGAKGYPSPTIAEMKALRAHEKTPPEWREAGRRVKSRQEIGTENSQRADSD